jgi:hypothetical protein
MSRRIDRNQRVCARFTITHGPGERPRGVESAESAETYPGAIWAGPRIIAVDSPAYRTRRTGKNGRLQIARRRRPGRLIPTRAARGSTDNLHLRRGESLPSLRRQSDECSRRQGHQALAPRGRSHLNTDTSPAPEGSLTQSGKSATPGKKQSARIRPKVARATKTTKTPRRPARSSLVVTGTEKLICRYCGRDDLAPSFKKRRDARCRACFKRRYSSAVRDQKATLTRKTTATK